MLIEEVIQKFKQSESVFIENNLLATAREAIRYLERLKRIEQYKHLLEEDNVKEKN